MRASWLPLLLLPLLAHADDGTDVLSLTASTYSAIVDSAPLILVEFFAPWCGHCKALAPHYEEAASALKERGIPLAKVDCVAEAELCQEHGISGYPTLKVYREGEITAYGGPRKAEGIVAYMIKQSLPSVATITKANHSEFIHVDKIVVVAYLTAPDDPPATVFKAYANDHRETLLFGASTDPAVFEEAGVTPPAIVVYKAFDEGRNDVLPEAVETIEYDRLDTFVKDNSIPLIDEVSGENYAVYVGTKLPLAYVFLDPAEEEPNAALVDSLRPLARENKGTLNFVWINADKFGEHAKSMNLKEAKWPAFVIQDIANNLKYPLDQAKPVELETVKQRVAAFHSGEAAPKIKSEPVPEEQDGTVYVVVGDTFSDVIFDDTRDVFVEFYAPWCGHCKRLAPTWSALGEKYIYAQDKLLIAKMDATENDVPANIGFTVQSFPTIKFKPAGSREFVDYDGDRSLESLAEFVETHVRNDLAGESAAQRPFTPTPSATGAQAAQTVHDEL